MFYSQDLLTKGRANSLAVVWLAATLGPRSSYKKLSKKEVLGVDVTKACEFLQQPPEPMALRLTSNLMVGVVRVLNAQYGFYMHDVNSVFLRLKRSFASLQTGNLEMSHDGRVEINMELHQIPLGQTLFEPGFNIEAVLKQNANLMEPPSKVKSDSVTDGNSLISLHEPSFDSFSVDKSVLGFEDKASTIGRSKESVGGYIGSHRESVDFGGGFGGEFIYDDLLSQVQKDLDVQKKNIGDIDLDWTLDLEGLGDDRQNRNKPPRTNNLEFHINENFGGATENYDIMPTPPRENAEKKKVHKQAKKRKVAVFDEAIELSHYEMVTMRDEAAASLDEADRKYKKKKMEDLDRQLVDRLLKEPGIVMSHASKDLWCKTIVTSSRSVLNRAPPTTELNRDYDNLQENGWGEENYFADPEQFRDAQERRQSGMSPVPWGAPSITATTRSGSVRESAGGDGFVFENQRMSLGSSNLSYPNPASKGMIDQSGLFDDTNYEMTQTQNGTQKETGQFYHYVRDIMKSAGTSTVHLFDLLQVSACTKHIASQAFYHVLSLANNGQVDVHQEVPYDDIQITMLAGF